MHSKQLEDTCRSCVVHRVECQLYDRITRLRSTPLQTIVTSFIIELSHDLISELLFVFNTTTRNRMVWFSLSFPNSSVVILRTSKNVGILIDRLKHIIGIFS